MLCAERARAMQLAYMRAHVQVCIDTCIVLLMEICVREEREV